MSDNFDLRVIRSSVARDAEPEGLAEYLARRFTYRNVSAWRERIAAGELSLNNIVADLAAQVSPGDTLEYRPGDLTEPEVDENVRILHESAAFLVVAKPAGLPAHPAGPYFRNTLWHILSRKYGKIHLVSRLDRETSGLLIAARTPETIRFFEHSRLRIAKTYHALVHGDFAAPRRAAGSLVPDTESVVHKKRRFIEGETEGEWAETYLKPLRRFGAFTLVEARPETGRLHQIRATLHGLGFPVVGDKMYGVDAALFLKFRAGTLDENDARRLILPFQALHSAALRFPDPENGEELSFALPENGWLLQLAEKKLYSPEEELC